ncbi:MAG TPA: energy transducer TonB [Stellaceae bacterium]|nr:energy transducer TonB [Stellaceae bacterium]
MTEVRLPLVLSVAGHAAGLLVLVWLSTRLPPLRLSPPAVPEAIDVIFQPPPVVAPKPPPPPPVPKVVPPPPPPPPPPPLPKVELPPPPPPPVRRVERPRPPPPKPHLRRRIERRRPPPPPRREPLSVAPPQTASLPPPRPRPRAAPVVTGDYRSALALWLERHKRYPLSARENSEEGRATLRFRVDRSGRVLSYAVVQSTGHPDLDAAVEAMMRGATLPPFPADMTASNIEVSVVVRFSLE